VARQHIAIFTKSNLFTVPNTLSAFYHTYLIYPHHVVAQYGPQLVYHHHQIHNPFTCTLILDIPQDPGLIFESIAAGIQHYISALPIHIPDRRYILYKSRWRCCLHITRKHISGLYFPAIYREGPDEHPSAFYFER